jgi:5-methylcytosine-specific restriction endonuclease McrA
MWYSYNRQNRKGGLKIKLLPPLSNRYIVNKKIVKARKEHTCKNCGKKIKKGQEYVRTLIHLDTYEYYAVKSCIRCNEQFEQEMKNQLKQAKTKLHKNRIKNYLLESYKN